MTTPELEPADTLVSAPGREEYRQRLFGGALQLDAEDLAALLPHRAPNRLLDRVITLVPGQHGVGLKTVSGNECGLSTREHGFVFPSTLALEALAQLAIVVYGYESAVVEGHIEAIDAEALPTLGGITHLEVHREMVLGNAIYLSVALGRPGDGRFEVVGQVLLVGEPYIDARFEMILPTDAP